MINVSFLASDPLFAEKFTMQTPEVFVDEHGRTQQHLKESVLVGSVQPATPQQVAALASTSSRKITAAVNIWTKTRLTAGDGVQGADRINVHGLIYTVTQVEDFKLNGGYYHAIAELVTNDGYQ